MDDAQVPADSDDKGEARRPARRLSDAETVAATRRDMFGDGSLLDTLAGSVAAPEAPNGVADAPAAAPANPAGPSAALADEHGDPGFADPFPPGQLASFPQSLDDIIDAFPTGPSARNAEGSDLQGPSPSPSPSPSPRTSSGFLPPPRLTAMDQGLGSGGRASDPPFGAASERSDVSSIFNSLSPLDGHGEPLQAAAEAIPALIETAGTPQTAQNVGEFRGDSAAGDTPEAPSGMAPTLATLMLPPTPQIPGPPHPETEGMPQFSDADMPQFAEPLRIGGAPPFAEPPQYPEDASSAQAYPEDMPQFAEPLRIGGAAPYAETPAYPEDPGIAPYAVPVTDVYAVPVTEGYALPVAEAPDVLPYAEPPVLPPFVTSADATPGIAAPPLPPPLVHSTAGSEAETAVAPMFDAAAKIAAEASATAEALENLKRMLGQHVADAAATPQPQQPPPLPRRYAQAHFRPDPEPYAASAGALLMPMPVAPRHARSKSIYLLGFLTGLGLSLMAGVALYLLINVG
jgi:hypothetical protein